MFSKRTNKFGVSPKWDRTVDGIVFASKKEATRYGELKLLEAGGKIAGLELQPKFRMVINDIHVCTYIADFQYTENGGTVVEDTKSQATRRLPAYRIKNKLMKAIYGIDIKET
ncbi:MAG: hypothetical protein CL480_11320 [Acidobacteria bacterium]|nr:hypothetical protein [Acidobacteriota bacterium]MBE41876.1 hypothetical protein [Acidobacteriota bacterium]